MHCISPDNPKSLDYAIYSEVYVGKAQVIMWYENFGIDNINSWVYIGIACWSGRPFGQVELPVLRNSASLVRSNVLQFSADPNRHMFI